jgi:hypothetical protein
VSCSDVLTIQRRGRSTSSYASSSIIIRRRRCRYGSMAATAAWPRRWQCGQNGSVAKTAVWPKWQLGQNGSVAETTSWPIRQCGRNDGVADTAVWPKRRRGRNDGTNDRPGSPRDCPTTSRPSRWTGDCCHWSTNRDAPTATVQPSKIGATTTAASFRLCQCVSRAPTNLPPYYFLLLVGQATIQKWSLAMSSKPLVCRFSSDWINWLSSGSNFYKVGVPDADADADADACSTGSSSISRPWPSIRDPVRY